MNKTKECQLGHIRDTNSARHQASHRARWSSNSKFNRILGNIERSIFGNATNTRQTIDDEDHDNNNNGREDNLKGSKQPSANKQTTSNKKKSKQQTQSSRRVPANDGTNMSKTTTTTSQGNTSLQPPLGSTPSSSRTTTDNVTSSTASLARNLSSQLTSLNKPATSSMANEPEMLGNMTLNKFQQQLASSLRPNSNHRQHNLFVGNNNNKLSIPPPHANGEARIQHHNLLFANSSSLLADNCNNTNNNKCQPFDAAKASLEPANNQQNSSKNVLTSTLSRLNLNKNNSNKFLDESTAARHNSSPASSAKSLPVLKSGSQLFKNNNNNNDVINEDEDSGFSTYQSRRSILAENQAQNASSSTLTTTTNSDQQQQQQSNNMHPTAQMLANSNAMLNYNSSHNLNSHSNNFLPYQQNQFMLDYNHQQANNNNFRHQQQQQQQQWQFYNRQLAQSNQVPIMTTVNSSNLNYHNNHNNNPALSRLTATSQQLPSHQFQQSPASNQLFNESRPLNSSSNNLYGSYPTTSNEANVARPPIYVNPPPKPRRYQYYDVGAGRQLLLSQQQSIASTKPQTTTTMAPIASAGGPHQVMPYNQRQQQLTFYNGPQMQHHLAQQQQQQHQQFKQHHNQPGLLVNPNQQLISSASYLSVASLHQNNTDNMIKPTQRPQTIRGGYHLEDPIIPRQQQQQQQYLIGQPQPLIKSKSSLDAGDLARLRQNRQTMQTINAQYLEQEQPIYASPPANLNNLYHVNTSQPPLFSGPQLPVQVGGNLQRSKSVTHLLPESDQNSSQRFLVPSATSTYANVANRTNNGNNLAVPKPFQAPLMSSSNSTNNLHLLGGNRTSQDLALTGRGQLNELTRHRSSYNLNDSRQYMPVMQQPMKQMNHQQIVSSLCQQRTNWTPSESLAPLEQQPQHAPVPPPPPPPAGKQAKPMFSSSQNGNKSLIRHSTGDTFGQQDSLDGSQAKQSLDDKIRHLLIGASDNNEPSFVDASQSGAAFVRSNASSSARATSNVMYQTAKNNAISSAQQQQPTTTSITQQQRHASKGLVKTTSSSCLFANDEQQDHRTHCGPQATSKSNQNEPLKVPQVTEGDKPLAVMGNRQQRQYDVSKQAAAAGALESRRPSDASNSQLIVDLTTPRVLAKTQTTLLAVNNNNNPQPTWTINQPGLPLITSHRCTGESAVSSSSREARDDTSSTAARDLIGSTHQQAPAKMSDCQRTPAPYYYSDLKSEEQRQALLSIVQQKSLSPPPQLLSRSIDQSGTRLTSRAATLHPGQARLLSESLGQKRLAENLRRATNPTNEFSSTTNIAKNIDRLFEVSPPTSAQIPAVQSMLALNCEHKDIVDVEGGQIIKHIDSTQMSSGYDTGAMRTASKFSKSKSLDNISQKSNPETTVGCSLINPVYENILRSEKLMSAIKDSTDFSGKDNNNNSQQSGLNRPVARISASSSSSDESMDSILGSSLDESDSSSSDIIDKIKISSTDNHLSDISQLIEQLKSNHSKLTDEYKATLLRISKTINSKTKQMYADSNEKQQQQLEGDDKLAKRLHLLELKSKKCESRSRNQLALIQMMEKVLRQSRLRASSASCSPAASCENNKDNRFSPNDSSQSLIEGHDRSPSKVQTTTTTRTVLNNDSNSQVKPTKATTVGSYKSYKHTSEACLSSDEVHQSAKQTDDNNSSLCQTTDKKANENDKQQPTESGRDGQLDVSGKDQAALSRGGGCGGSPSSSLVSPSASSSPSARPSKEIIKAIVTETKSSCEFVKTSSPSPTVKAVEQANTKRSTLTLNGLPAAKTKDNNVTSPTVARKSNGISQRIQDIEMRSAIDDRQQIKFCARTGQNKSKTTTTTNPLYKNVGQVSSDEQSSDDSCVSLKKNLKNENGNQSNKSPSSSSSSATISEDDDSNNLASRLLRDDDDFIEFLSNSSHRSQFEASQFSASDFNNSSSTSASESSAASNAGNDSLNSLISPKAARQTGSAALKSGILKNKLNGCERTIVGRADPTPASGCRDHFMNTMQPLHRRHQLEEDGDDEDDDMDDLSETTSAAKKTTTTGSKFKSNNNVFGNVIDVDVVCTQVNNGTSSS